MATRQGSIASTSAVRGPPSSAASSPTWPPASISAKVTSRPEAVRPTTRTRPSSTNTTSWPSRCSPMTNVAGGETRQPAMLRDLPALCRIEAGEHGDAGQGIGLGAGLCWAHGALRCGARGHESGHHTPGGPFFTGRAVCRGVQASSARQRVTAPLSMPKRSSARPTVWSTRASMVFGRRRRRAPAG